MCVDQKGQFMFCACFDVYCHPKQVMTFAGGQLVEWEKSMDALASGMDGIVAVELLGSGSRDSSQMRVEDNW